MGGEMGSPPVRWRPVQLPGTETGCRSEGIGSWEHCDSLDAEAWWLLLVTDKSIVKKENKGEAPPNQRKQMWVAPHLVSSTVLAQIKAASSGLLTTVLNGFMGLLTWWVNKSPKTWRRKWNIPQGTVSQLEWIILRDHTIGNCEWLCRATSVWKSVVLLVLPQVTLCHWTRLGHLLYTNIRLSL